jgi:hypothetical protein
MLAVSLAAASTYASGKISDNGAQSTQILGLPGVFGIQQRLDQRGTDDHQISESGHLARLLAIGYPQADSDHRRRIDLTQSPHELRSGR